MQLRRKPPPYLPPPAAQLECVYADSDMLVLNKPAGLLSVPGKGPEKARCVVTDAQERFGPAYIVHRLDMDTSGLIVLARTIECRRALAHAFQTRQVKKRYLALIEGVPDELSGTIDRPVARYSRQRPLRHLEAGGLSAITHWRLINTAPEGTHSRIELTPLTGRSHQLRLHMQSIGHAILGDPLYGQPRTFSRLALHATQLTFCLGTDPIVHEFDSPAPF